jgi:hypothetical protein
MAGPPRNVVYPAQVALPTTLARIQAARSVIELSGGKLEFIMTTTPELTVVRVTLPESLPLEAVLPGIPFFPL